MRCAKTARKHATKLHMGWHVGCCARGKELIMRAALLIASLFVGSSALAGEPTRDGRTRDDVDSRSLSAEQVQHYAASYYPMIRTCYFEHGRTARGATGELALKLVVHRGGHIHDVTVDAPGVTGKALRKLEACIRLQVLGWHFPVRRDFTTAILPYYFLYLDIPGAGPQYSCWNPRGCPAKPTNRR
jgi:hypothetical protein